MVSEVDSDAPAPRLCHLRTRSDFQGYGFNLHADKDMAGQYIGKVDHGSPAEMAGLREGDRIIEVNGVNVCNENHHQIVERIKSKENEAVFLVLQPHEDIYYREREIVVHSKFPNVIHLETPLEEHHEKESYTDEIKAHFGKLRLCHLRVWPHFEGYGFNLHVLKDTNKQHIGKVDSESPAEAGGLKEEDRLLEVNGKPILEASHADVVKMVKEHSDHVDMLVTDEETFEFYQSKGLNMTSKLPGVTHIYCPERKEIIANGNHVYVKTEEKEEHVKSDDKIEDEHKLRFCHIKSWNDGQGFGFNMQSEKDKPGQYITKVDSGSPAELGGLKLGDRIVAVNGTVVLDKTHSEVVSLIKENLAESNILVVNKEDFLHLEGKGIDFSKADDKYIVHIHCPDTKPTNVESKDKIQHVEEVDHKKNDTSSNDLTPSPLIANESLTEVLLFAATAEEARKRMNKKKAAENMSLKAKYDLFKKL